MGEHSPTWFCGSLGMGAFLSPHSMYALSPGQPPSPPGCSCGSPDAIPWAGGFFEGFPWELSPSPEPHGADAPGGTALPQGVWPYP